MSDEHGMFLEKALQSLAEGTESSLIPELGAQTAVALANLVESLPIDQRKRIWALLTADQQGEVITHTRDDVRTTLIEDWGGHELIAASRNLADDDLTDVIADLPEDMSEQLWRVMDDDRRARIQRALEFEVDTAGRLMNSDVISVRPDVTLAVVLRYLRRLAPLPDDTDALCVVDEAGRYLGVLTLPIIVSTDSGTLVKDVMVYDSPSVVGTVAKREVVLLFEEKDLLSLPVVDEHHLLLGRITVDDVVDVIVQQSEQQWLNTAGLHEEEDLFAPVVASTRRRALWLGTNLLTVLVASWVISQFEGVLDQVVALAVLMPIVASMGGIAGSQSLTLAIRGIAVNQLTPANFRWFARKEVTIGLLNGVLWAVVIAGVTMWWFSRWDIAAIIAVAMILNLFAGALSGVGIPMILSKLRVDPALAGAVVLTTATDIVGFAGFLGLATILLL